MTTLEERVAFLEGRVGEQSSGLDGVRQALTSLELRIDRRFDAVDRRFEGVERRLGALDDKISRQFVWLIGIQVTTLASVVAAFGAVVAALVSP